MNFWKAIAAAIELHSGEEQTQAELHNVARMGEGGLHYHCITACVCNESWIIYGNNRSFELISSPAALTEECFHSIVRCCWMNWVRALELETLPKRFCCLGAVGGVGWHKIGINYPPVYDFFITHRWFRNSYSRCVLGIVNCLNAVTTLRWCWVWEDDPNRPRFCE